LNLRSLSQVRHRRVLWNPMCEAWDRCPARPVGGL